MKNAIVYFFQIATLQVAISSFAQSLEKGVVDSLISTLETEMSDSLRIESLKRITMDSRDPEILMEFSLKLDSIGLNLKDPELRIHAYQCMSNAWRFRGNLNKALEMLYIGLEISNRHDLKVKTGEIHGQIGLIHTANEDHQKALEANRLTNAIFNQIGMLRNEMYSYMNIGYSYYKLEMYDSALVNYDLGKKINDSLNIEWLEGYFLGNMALVKLELGALEEAEEDLIQAIEILKKIDDVVAISDFSINLGKVYELQDRKQKAIESATYGLELSRQLDLKEYIRDGSELLSKIYLSENDFENAFLYHQQYIANRDSIQNTQTVKRIANQQAEYEIGLKQAEVDLLEAQRETQRIVLWGLGIGLGLFLIFSIIIFRFYQAKNKLSKELSRQKQELEKLNNTKDKFFSIISHDLRSPVAAFMGVSRMIKILVQNKKTEDLLELTGEIDQSVDRLSGLLDNLLNWATQQQGDMPNIPEKINAREMIDNLVGVFRNMANSKQIELSSSIPENMSLWADKNSVATIFRNLINNALKFTPEGGQVQITGEEKEGMGIIKIEDTGMGMDENKILKILETHTYSSSYGTGGEKGLGLGLKLVQEFVKMNNGQINIESQEGKGTTFTINLPLYEEAKVLTD